MRGSSVPILAGAAGGSLLFALALLYLLRRRNQRRTSKYYETGTSGVDRKEFDTMSIDDGGDPNRNGLRKSTWDAIHWGYGDRAATGAAADRLESGPDYDPLKEDGVYGYSSARRR